MTIENLKSEILNRWMEVPGATLSVAIIDGLAHVPENQLRMLTISMLVKVAGKKEIDQEFLTALSILVGSREPLLETRTLLIDDDAIEHEISAEVIAEARATGELSHPETGDAVTDYESHLVPFFVPSKKFLEGRT